MSVKKFPPLVHLAYESDAAGSDEYLCVYTGGIDSMEHGTRCAVYKLVDEGYVRGPKSFVSKQRKSK